MRFSLEIQPSTGKVTLSHSGANSIYNHGKISYTFSKTDFDLNQLNFIHVSAGIHTVPIRNLIITFEKQPEPLNTIQPNSVDLSLEQSIDDSATMLSKLQTEESNHKSGKVIRFSISISHTRKFH